MKHVYLSGAAFFLSLLPTAAALAQTGPADQLEEIVVTAQRRAQSSQDVGIAMSVLSGDDLINKGVAKINDLQNSTPSLDIEPAFGGGAAQFRLRGVGFQDYASNNAPTVGVYVNEVAYPVPIMTQGMLFDIARVEVLRGPQGTLYGRNTTGGAISFITNRPTDELKGGVRAEYGRYDAFKGEAYLSGPVSDKVRLRVSAATEQGGGWQHNRDTGEEIGDADKKAVRGLAEIDVTDSLTATVDLHYGRDKSENQALRLLSDLTTRGGAGVFIPADTDRSATGWQISSALARDTNLPLDAKPGKDNSTWGASLALNWDLGAAKLTNITGFDRLLRKEYGDWDTTASSEADTFFGSDVKVYSNETRLSSNGDGPFQWIAGVYYSRQELNERYYSDFLDIYGTYARVQYDQVVESLSGFGQAEYAFTEQWKLIGGLRYEKEDRKLNGFGSAFGGATALPPTDVKTDMKPLTGKASLEFKPIDPVLLYASVSKGTKSGGFTTYNTGNSSAIQPFKPETLWAYEIGTKTDVSRTLQINGSAFYYDYKNQQVLSATWGANGPVGRFVNVPKSEIYGMELEGRWQPMRGLNISQSFSYKHGEYKEFFDMDTGASRAAGYAVYVDKAGQRIPFPKYTYGGSVAYTADLDPYLLETEFNYSYRSKYPSWLGTKYDVDGYWLANLNITARPADGPWSLGVWVRNLFDEKYDLTRNFFTSADLAQSGTPRTYGLRMSYDF